MAPILVVDDQPDLGSILVRLLRLYGHEAAAVLDGPAALDFVQETPPAMVILDAMMPGMSGFDVLRTLRADPRFEGLPVVVYSALSDPASRDRAIALGAQDYLVKAHTTYDELYETVRRYAAPRAAA